MSKYILNESNNIFWTHILKIVFLKTIHDIKLYLSAQLDFIIVMNMCMEIPGILGAKNRDCLRTIGIPVSTSQIREIFFGISKENNVVSIL